MSSGQQLKGNKAQPAEGETGSEIPLHPLGENRTRRCLCSVYSRHFSVGFEFIQRHYDLTQQKRLKKTIDETSWKHHCFSLMMECFTLEFFLESHGIFSPPHHAHLSVFCLS